MRAALREFAGGSSVDAEVEATAFDAAKARFTGAIIPGQTIETRLWRGGSSTTTTTSGSDHLTRIHFECYALETGSRIISSAFVDLKLPPPQSTFQTAPLARSTLLSPAPASSAVAQSAHHNYQQDKHLDSRHSTALTSSTTISTATGDLTAADVAPMAPQVVVCVDK